ncbi:MAG: ABC transporter substrate-binding protein [Eubacteriales bacterium]|nr:ABC transporter substrate-binding protein [Eubacteriales bacterium]
MKKVLALMLAAAMVLGLVACGSKPATTETQAAATEAATTKAVIENQVATKEAATAAEGETLTYKKDIVIAHHQANVARGPQDTGSGMQKILGFMIFNRLTIFDPESKELKGSLAESFEQENGGQIWTFHLRKGIKFQNGEELTADDCLYTYERAKEFGKSTSAWVDPIETIEVIDDYTVKYTLKKANMDFAFQMSTNQSSILNREANEADPEIGYGIGTGGWMIDEFVANDYTKFKRFDESWVWEENGINPTETITIKYMADQNARMLGVQAGDLDIGCIANNAEFYNYQKIEGLNPVVAASWSCDYVGMNANCEYFKDINVRKAVAYAINKDEALEIINNGFGLTCKSMWCPDTIGYKENFEENYEYNVEKAKEYLAKSAYPNGFTCKLTTINAYSLYAETVQAQLAAIGINCEVELTDSPGMNEAGKAGTLEMYVWNSTMSPFGDFSRKLITSDGASNYAHFKNEKIDKLMSDAAAEGDAAKRAELYEQVQDELNADCYLVPMFFGYLSNLTRDNVEGYQFTSEGYYMYNVRAIEK